MAKGITIILQSYKVRVSVGGKQYTVGKFSTEKEASELYKKATDCKARADAAARRMFEKEMALSQVAKPPSKTYEERLVLAKALERADDIYAHTNHEGPAPELAWGIDRLERYLEEHRATEEAIEEYRSRIQRWIRDKKDRWGNPLIDGDSPQDPILGFDAKGDFVQPDDDRNQIGLVVFKTLQEVEAYEAAAKPLPVYEYDFDKTATDAEGECYLIDNYETSVDPDYPEYMTWINRQGVAEFKTEY